MIMMMCCVACCRDKRRSRQSEQFTLRNVSVASKSHIQPVALANSDKWKQSDLSMNHWTRNKFFILLLGVFVTLSIGLSNVAANTMTLKMPMTSEMASSMSSGMSGDSGKKDCGDCGGTDSKAMLCAAGYVASVPAVLDQIDILRTKVTLLSFPAKALRLTSRAYPPDPYPPRTSDIG